MRIAVTGKQGQVVSPLVEIGPELGVEVTPVGRPELDLLLPETVQPALASVRPDIIVNAAAYTAVDRAETEPEVAMAVNAKGASAVASTARTLGVPVVQLSTDYVFDGSKPKPYVEDDAVAPANAYGASKLAGERELAAVTRDHVIVRTAWVYSPYGKNFVRTMLALAQSRTEIKVVADQYGCRPMRMTSWLLPEICWTGRKTTNCAGSFIWPVPDKQTGPSSLQRFLDR